MSTHTTQTNQENATIKSVNQNANLIPNNTTSDAMYLIRSCIKCKQNVINNICGYCETIKHPLATHNIKFILNEFRCRCCGITLSAICCNCR